MTGQLLQSFDLGYFVRSLIGAAVFGALMYWVWKAFTHRWRQLEQHYSGKDIAPAKTRLIENVLLSETSQRSSLARYVWVRNYSGITSVGASPQGLSLRLIPPFGIGCKPIFIPSPDWSAEKCDWYLNSKSFAIKAARRPDIDITVPASLMDWINLHSGR